MKLFQKEKETIAKIGEKFNLKLIIIYGSYAKGIHKKKSDLDIAILGKKPIDFKTELEIYSALSQVFGDNKERELDVKFLHKVDSFFRYQAMKDAVLIYGNLYDFNIFKIYAIRCYQENQKLRELKDYLIKKRQKHLEKLYVR